MNAGWERKRVAELAHHSLGKMLDKTKNRGDPRPYLRNINVRWFGFDLSDVQEMRFLPSEAERYTVRRGDVVVCEGGYPGRAAIWDGDEPIYFQKALHRVRFHEPAHARWFLYYLHAKDLDGTLKEHFNGAGIQHFTGEALARFEVPVAPLDEQQRIVAVLDEAFAGIAAARANAERNLGNARALFEAELEHAFDELAAVWPRRALSDLGITTTGSTPPSTDAANYGDHIPFIKPGDFRSDGTLTYDNAGLSAAGLAQARRVQAGSALMVCIGATIGKAGYCDRDVTTNQQINTLTPRDGTSGRFLYHQMCTASFQQRVRGNAGQMTLPIISKSKWSALTVVVPPPDEQHRIAAHLDALSQQVRRLEAIYQRKLAALDELKRSLLHHAFTGQLTDRTAAHAP